MKKHNYGWLAWLLLSCSGPINAAESTLLQQRWQFQEAVNALQAKDITRFTELQQGLAGYPIAHYLQYFYLRDQLASVKPQQVDAFLTQNPDSPVTALLRRSWLNMLAKQKNWAAYLSAYTPQESVGLQCLYLQAQIKTNTDVQSVIEPAQALWTVGKSQPDVCDPVFDYLYQQNAISAERRFERVRLMLQVGELRLAAWLAKPLPAAQQAIVSQWQQMHDAPEQSLSNAQGSDDELYRSLLQYGLMRLARTDAAAAYSAWQSLQKRYAFSTVQQGDISAEIAVRAAWQDLPDAASWLMALKPEFRSERVWRTHLQLLLKQQDWASVLAVIPRLSKEVQSLEVWRYWQARAAEQQQQAVVARALYLELAKQRSYYGFLAADHLQQSYQFNEESTVIAQTDQTAVDNNAAVIRARELFFTGFITEARREWNAVLNQLSTDEQKKAAAALASQWGWHDRAIISAAKSGDYNNLSLRFPTPHYDAVLTYATQHELRYPWVYAIIRQESAFQADARSSSNALGLMQLLPATAKEVAGRYDIALGDESSILTPDINIQLGTGYLHHLMERFDNNIILSTAAYNAGPSRSIRWRKEFGCLPTDVFVELIPFQQTRDYVQNILAYMPIFEYRLMGSPEVQRLNLDRIVMNVDCPTANVLSN